MSPTTKESELSVSSKSASGSGSAGKPQPVALEIPVTVNGARTVDGSEKREPFSETTQTVLVFANGAVIRLSSGVAPGQLLFLTNEKTKKEVVCQVVKSKNYRNVSGYVELEFTEMAVGFWGVRFPDDRVTVKTVAPRPAPVVNPASVVHAASGSNPAIVPAPAAPSLTASGSSAPVGTTASKQPSSAAGISQPRDAEVERLRQEAARLQEKLSSLSVAKAPEAPAAQFSLPPQTAKPAADAKFGEFSKSPQTPAKGTQPQKYAIPALAPDPEETLKIPSWLEPLARNTASATSEVPARVDTKAPVEVTSVDAPVLAGVPEETAESAAPLALPNFGASLLEEHGGAGATAASGGSRTGLFVGAIAATLLLVAGGAWYANKSGVFGSATAAARTPFNEAAPSASTPVAQQQSQLNAVSSSAAQSVPAPLGGDAESAVSPQTLQATAPQPVPVHEVEKIPSDAAANSRRAGRVVREEPKKPSLGEVHFAAPTVTSAATEQISAREPNLGGSQSLTGPAPSSSGLVAGRAKQPAAPPPPLPVGGDVKPARLISTTRPIYPTIARAQRISGDVVVDALIDEQGHVTTMKVLSGPSMLHQSAMDALRQWKYLPATLDGKPVAMHLSVKLQFRIQ